MDASPAGGCDTPNSISMDFTHVFLPQSPYMLHTFHHSQLHLQFPPPSSFNSDSHPTCAWKCIDRLVESLNSALDEINHQCSHQLLLSTIITTHHAALEPWKGEYKSLPTYLLQVAKYLQHIYTLPLLKVPAHTSPTTTLPLPPTRDVGMAFHCWRILGWGLAGKQEGRTME